MDQKRFSWWLRVMIVCLGLIGAVLYFLVLPFSGNYLADAYPEFAYAFWPWLVFLWLTGIPCYLVLVFGWKIAVSIGKDHSFSYANADRLKKIVYLIAGDTIFFALGNMVFCVWNLNPVWMVLFSALLIFMGILISVIAAALSHLVRKAANLQEQSDWTI